MEEHNHHHPPKSGHWATKLYYVTYVTGLLSIVLSLWTSVHLVASGTRPSLGHTLMVASLLLTTVCALPYMWSKRFARYKMFAYLAGWSVSLVLLVVASFAPA
tara:strand:- start:378 stop:686 length:309 start_codon:yes stop_codon:yes gene_type:complete